MMRFIIDENIPPDAVHVLRAHQLEAFHVNNLKAHKKHRIVDDQLRRLTIQKGHILITKDDDFVKSYVDRKVPEKLIFLYGSQNKSEDLTLIKKVAPKASLLLQMHDFIEVRPEEIRFPFSDPG